MFLQISKTWKIVSESHGICTLLLHLFYFFSINQNLFFAMIVILLVPRIIISKRKFFSKWAVWRNCLKCDKITFPFGTRSSRVNLNVQLTVNRIRYCKFLLFARCTASFTRAPTFLESIFNLCTLLQFNGKSNLLSFASLSCCFPCQEFHCKCEYSLFRSNEWTVSQTAFQSVAIYFLSWPANLLL